MLRRGNHHSAKFWRSGLLPVIERYRNRDIPKYFRGDAAFALPALFCLLEEEGFRYAVRIPANDVLIANIDHLLIHPVGRPSHKPKMFYEPFSYQAQSWDHPRRAVAKVEWHEGELFPRVGFIVTNMTGWSRKVVHFYNQKGQSGAMDQRRQVCRESGRAYRVATLETTKSGFSYLLWRTTLETSYVGWRCRGVFRTGR